ncbi:MAG: DUF2298 domain-containing protein [Candidatus Shapirobacteria bacterium]|jgi:uncharacterized membrane protein
MIADLKYIILWWLTIFLLGLVSLPLIFSIFKNFWDKGYAFCKTLSLIALTYLVLVLSIFKFLPFTNQSLLTIISIGLLADYLYLKNRNNRDTFVALVKSNYKTFIAEELIFLLILTLWSFVRGFAPDIEGLEKFMDWGFVNSALRSTYLPPADMWFSGEYINYYYFGHLMSAVLTKLSYIPSTITYNLSIASICALTFISSFSLSSNLVYNFFKKNLSFRSVLVAGMISGLLLTFGGNFHSVYKISKINKSQNDGVLTLTLEAIKKAADSYWYPDATRFIGYDPETKDKTIHEFPIYSYVVADLHGHMSDIPTVLFFMAFIFAMSMEIIAFPYLKLIVPCGLILSICYMTNAWDFAVYGLLFGIFYLLKNCKETGLWSGIVKTFSSGIGVILFWYLFTLPFSLNFIPMAEGLKLSDARSPLFQLFILYGGFWIITAPLMAFYLFRKNEKSKKIDIPPVDIFIIALVVTATILVIIPEIGYIKDIYIYEHRRSNTMFKLVYQAFMMYSLASGFALIRIGQIKSSWKVLYKIAFLIVFIIHMIYPFFAVRSYYGLKEYKGLWGLTFLKNANPDNLEAVNWINKNIKGQPVMVEAVGDSYTMFNQISMATGLPTIEGWIVHEWLWRGGYEKPSLRQTDVQKLYEGETLDEVRSVLQKYSVDYIFVGDKEYEKYPKINEKNFTDIGATIVAQFGKTKIYKVLK